MAAEQKRKISMAIDPENQKEEKTSGNPDPFCYHLPGFSDTDFPLRAPRTLR